MTPDFTPYIRTGEQIMWQGESHKEGPPADPKEFIGMRVFSAVWTLFSGLIFGVVFFTVFDSTQKVNTGTKIVCVLAGLLFIGAGAAMFAATLIFRKEYYCLTDRRFIRMSEKGAIKQQSDLGHVLSAELTGMKNGYGSILMKTDIVHRSYSNGHHHTNREYWKMRGVDRPEECFRMLTGILQINDEFKQ